MNDTTPKTSGFQQVDCITFAVIQALRPKPNYLKANRVFFESQLDRFLRSEARIEDIQTSD